MASPHAKTARSRDIRPAVIRRTATLGPWVAAGVLVAGGSGFFYALQINRLNRAEQSQVVPDAASASTIVSPPPLMIPTPAFEDDLYGIRLTVRNRQADERPVPTIGVRDPGLPRESEQRMIQPLMPPSQQPSYPDLPSNLYGLGAGPVGGISWAPEASSTPTSIAAKSDPSGGADRVKAGKLINPSMTVPQGSVIHAVMETALDSTRPGYARAIVSKDVVSFDGLNILIPRGSKLFGDYKADLNPGVKRALIQWHRLTRPDGVIIDVDSPAADPLGRSGLKGKVNTHFFERFGGVILQSVLDLGVRAATREAAGDTIVFGVAPSVQGSVAQPSSTVRPTLKAMQGMSIAVFVGRDLDFSTAK